MAGEFVDSPPPAPNPAEAGQFVDAPAPGSPDLLAHARHVQQAASVEKAKSTIASKPSALESSLSMAAAGAASGGDPNAMAAAYSPAAGAATQGAEGSALNRIGTVSSGLSMLGNYGMRELAGDKNLNPQIKQIVTQGGLFGDVGKKIDALGQLLGPGGPGELEFWTSQPGVHDAIMNSHPTTPEGAYLQLVMGVHSDFARWKAGHPLANAVETFGQGLVDPTAMILGGAAGKIIGAAGKVAGEFSDAAGAAARSADATRLPNAPLTHEHTSTVYNAGGNTPPRVKGLKYTKKPADADVYDDEFQTFANRKGPVHRYDFTLNDKPVGSAEVSHPQASGIPHIENLEVKSGARRQGVGQSMLQHINDDLHSQGYKQVTASPNDKSEGANAKIWGAGKSTAINSSEAFNSTNSKNPFIVLGNTVEVNDLYDLKAPEKPSTTTTTTKTTGPDVTFGKVSPVAKAGSLFGRTFADQINQYGPGMKTLARGMKDDMPIIGDRYAAMKRKYGPAGEFLHNEMVDAHAQVPVKSATQMLSNDLFGGLTKEQKLDMAQAVEDLPKTAAAQKGISPNRQVPIRGVSVQQRAENWSQQQMDKLTDYKTLMPKTYELLMPPKTYGHYEEMVHDPFMGPNNANARILGEPTDTPVDPRYRAAPHYDPREVQGPSKSNITNVTPLQVSDFFPRRGLWIRANAKPGVGASGQQGNFGMNIKRRTFGTIEQSMKPQLKRDFNGQVYGKTEGAKPNDDWDASQAATRKDIQMENYATMLRHVDNSFHVIDPETGLPAGMHIEYNWRGGRGWRGAVMQHKGKAINLEQPFNLGSGPEAADKANAMADDLGPFIKSKAEKAGQPITDAKARQLAIDYLQQGFFEKHPGHVPAGPALRSPDRDGVAVEATMLRAIADANPVLRWLGTSQSVTSRLPQEAKQLTEFQNKQAFKNGTISGITPEAMQQLHFNGVEDDNLGHAPLLRAYDTITSFIRMGKLFFFGYHPVFNVHPALTNLMLEQAGSNPIKIAKYSTQLDSALMGASMNAFPEAIRTAKQIFSGGNLMGHEMPLGAKYMVPSDWMKDAEKYHVTSRGAYGTGVPIDQYVRLFSAPMDSPKDWISGKELSLGEKAQRAIASGSQWNQNLTFNVMEANMTATAFHILTHDEKIAPEVAARMVNKSINDYNNLTDAERNPWLGRLYWFYSFKKMMLRQAARSLSRHANVLGTESRVIQNWNQQQGDPEAGDRAIVTGQDANGTYHLMSTSQAPYRFGSDVAAMTGLGGEKQAGRAYWANATGTLAPVPDAVARGLAQMSRAATGASTTPKPWDIRSGFGDVDQPIDVQIRQAMGIMGNEFSPTPMSITPTQYTSAGGQQYKQMAIASGNLRNMVKHMDPKTKRLAMSYVERLDNGDVTAVGPAKAMYASLEGSLRKSGW